MDKETRFRYQAIDRCLSYCVFTAHDARRVFQKIHAPFPLCSKRRIALVLALLSLLLAAAASALGILWRQGLEQTASLYQQYGSEENWSLPEYEKALRIFSDIGIDLSDLPDTGSMDEALACQTLETYLLSKIPGETDSLHERLREYNGFFSTWSLEEKAWYSEICEKYGLPYIGGMICALPGDGEMTVDQATALAVQKLESHDALSPSSLEPYQMTVSYFAYENAPDTKYWQFSWIDPASERAEVAYRVTFLADGSDVEDGYYRAKTEEEMVEYAEHWNQREIQYLDIDNPDVDWTPEYLKKYNAAGRQYGSRLNWPMDVKADLYGDDMPSADMLTPDDALNAAQAYITACCLPVSDLYPNVRYREEYGYMIWFYPDAYGNENFIYFTTVNAVTGECEGISER